MMRKVFLTLSFSVLNFVLPLSKAISSERVLILKQKSDDVHNMVVKGFTESISKDFRNNVLEADANGSLEKAKSYISEAIKKYRRFYIFTVGIIPTYAAFELLSDKRQVPVVFTLVFSPERLGKLPKNFCGVLMHPDPKESLSKFSQIFQKENELYIPFSDSSESAAEELKKEGEKLGIKVILRRVRTDEDIMDFLNNYQKNLAPLWLLPDPLIVNPDTIPIITDISKNSPVIAFSRVLLNLGAKLSYEIDFYELGKKSAEIIQKIIKKEIDIRKEKFFYPQVKYLIKEDISLNK